MATKSKAPEEKQPSAKEKLNALGVDGICEFISEGLTLTAIAQQIGVSIGSLIGWIEAEPERSARVREARSASARIWDEKAVEVIEDAADPFELTKARELAQHYRWRASKTAPREYGDRQQIDVNDITPKSQAQVDIELAALIDKAKRVAGNSGT